MNYQKRLFLSHSATAILASGLVYAFSTTSNPVEQATCVILFPLTFVLPTVSSARWFVKAINRVTKAIETKEALREVKSGIHEIDLLVGQIHDSVEWDRDGWSGIQRLLEQMAPKSSQNGSAQKVVVNGRLLAQVLTRISRAIGAEVGRILNHVNTISQRSHESAHEAQEQSKSLDLAIEHVETLSQNIDQILSHADSANHSAADARQAAIQGQELIELLIRGMQRIRSQVETSERKVLSLGERSQEISSIVETMSMLSSRTDILALNASIEAVRAGEQGQGFAVVAEEVRKLAEHTNNASREISELIDAIQIETQDTIKMMAEERSQVQEEVARVNEAGTALEKIRQTSSDSADRVSEISRITIEQLKGTQDMIQGMQHVSQLANGIHDRSTFVRQSAQDLISVTRDLEQWISPMFHCDEESRVARDLSAHSVSQTAADKSASPRSQPQQLAAAGNGGSR